jgi:hypothetical protein
MEITALQRIACTRSLATSRACESIRRFWFEAAGDGGIKVSVELELEAGGVPRREQPGRGP